MGRGSEHCAAGVKTKSGDCQEKDGLQCKIVQGVPFHRYEGRKVGLPKKRRIAMQHCSRYALLPIQRDEDAGDLGYELCKSRVQ